MFNTVKSLATIAVLAVAAGSATASAADTANVSPQPTLKSGQISPVRIPGTKVRKGTKSLRAATVCATRSYIKHSPGRLVVGTVFSGEPVAVRRVSASGKWTQITAEAAQPGWVLSAALCRAGERPTSGGRTETG